MQTISKKDLIDLIKSNQITPYQIYGPDLEYPQIYSTDNYIQNQNDNIDAEQKLSVITLDIECYAEDTDDFDWSGKTHPINAITIYHNFTKTFYSFFLINSKISLLINDNNKNEIIKYYKNEFIKEGSYKSEDEFDIKINLYNNELKLIKDCWAKIHEIDPAILTGFNSDTFDFPYIYNRLNTLFNGDIDLVNQVLSKRFGCAKLEQFGNSQIVRIPEFSIADVRYLYLPRDEGGLNYGEKEAEYSLDKIAEKVLGLKKLEYNKEGLSLTKFYEVDPVNFFLYNIKDVHRTQALFEKLGHCDLHNMLRRLMGTSFDYSLRGSSALFDSFVLKELKKKQLYPRFGISAEKTLHLTEEDIAKIPKPKVPLVKKYTVKKIDKRTYSKVLSRYPGAYVKQPPKRKLYLEEIDGIIGDLDATSLYPSMILQHQIGFDTYFGRVIEPVTYRFIEFLDDAISKNYLNPGVYPQLAEYIKHYVKELEPQNKSDYIQNLYYITCHLMLKLFEKKCKIKERLFNPQSLEEYILQKVYLIPLLDIIDDIYPTSPEFNSFTYDYLLTPEGDELSNDEIKEIYIIENETETFSKIITLHVNDFEKYLKENNLCVSISGCLFLTHETKQGLFSEFLIRMKAMRDKYKKLRASAKEGSFEYKLYDKRQLAIKIAMNTTYGLYGLSSFRYSNRWLAKTITLQGRFTLKIAQVLADQYLKELASTK